MLIILYPLTLPTSCSVAVIFDWVVLTLFISLNLVASKHDCEISLESIKALDVSPSSA